MASKNVALSHHILTEQEKREICSWHYTGAYEIYNLPSFDQLKQRQGGFMNPETAGNYRAYYDEDVLVGFTNISEREAGILIGIGVKPALCGQGYGQSILSLACDISKKRYPGKPLYLEVRTWNKRAIGCYQKAGFSIEGAAFARQTPIGPGTFYRMVKP